MVTWRTSKREFIAGCGHPVGYMDVYLVADGKSECARCGEASERGVLVRDEPSHAVCNGCRRRFPREKLAQVKVGYVAVLRCERCRA